MRGGSEHLDSNWRQGDEVDCSMMTGNLTVTSTASVSKGDIELLENKIQVLEKQISKIKKNHSKVISDYSSTNTKARASYPMPSADNNNENELPSLERGGDAFETPV